MSLATTLSYIPDAEIEIIPNGINIANYKPKIPRSTSGGKKTIVYIGRLEKRKGVSFLLDAYAKLRETKNDVSLIIAGDGKLRTGLEARVAKLQIPDVSFVGFVSEGEKVRLLQTADVYCSPALYGESFGIVLLEALSAECVVVCGDNPGYRSVMVDQGKQSLVDPKDTDVFAERLQTMLYDKDARAQWLKWAKKYILQFDYPHVIDHTSRFTTVHKKITKVSHEDRLRTDDGVDSPDGVQQYILTLGEWFVVGTKSIALLVKPAN